MDERKILRHMSELFNTNVENLPNVLRRFKKDIEKLENILETKHSC